MSSSICDVPDLALVEEFQAPIFQTTRTIRWVHRATPRFGSTNDLLRLMSGSEEEQRDYVRGLIISAVAIFVFFMVWLIFLAVFRCMGPNEVGVLSGKPKSLPPRPSNDSEDLIVWTRIRNQRERRLNRLRMLVCICGIVIVISSCIMAVLGIASLTNSLNEGTEAIAITDSLVTRAITLIDRVLGQSEATSGAVDELLVDINDICPLQRPNGICTDLNDVDTCNFDEIFDGFIDGDIVVNVIKQFKEADKNIYFKELVNVRTNLEEFSVAIINLDSKAQSLNWALYCCMVGSMILMVLCLFIIFGMVFPKSRVVGCLRHTILVPAFSLFVLASFLFSMVFVIGSAAVADLCYGSPDDHILIILDRFRLQLSPIAVEIASFYINACPPDAIPQQIAGQLNFVLDAVPLLGGFSALVTQNTNLLQQVCGFENPAPLGSAAENANVELCQVVDLLNDIRLFFQCENWHPLYETIMYQAICYNGTEAFAWVASTQFIIAFFACLLLTCRAAFHEVTINEPSDESSQIAEIKDEDSLGDDYKPSNAASWPTEPSKFSSDSEGYGYGKGSYSNEAFPPTESYRYSSGREPGYRSDYASSPKEPYSYSSGRETKLHSKGVTSARGPYSHSSGRETKFQSKDVTTATDPYSYSSDRETKLHAREAVSPTDLHSYTSGNETGVDPDEESSPTDLYSYTSGTETGEDANEAYSATDPYSHTSGGEAGFHLNDESSPTDPYSYSAGTEGDLHSNEASPPIDPYRVSSDPSGVSSNSEGEGYEIGFHPYGSNGGTLMY